MRLKSWFTLVLLSALGAVVGVSSATDEPVVTVRFPAAMATGSSAVRGAGVLPVRAPAGGVVYFTIDTPLVGESSGKRVIVHRSLHFVVGGHAADHSSGDVRVNGPGVAGVKGHRALIDVTDGWVWVSDQPPSGWASGHTAIEHESPVTAGVLGVDGPHVHFPTNPGADAVVGWSIITLLRGEWTWAGAIGTEFIFRVAPDSGGGSRLEMVYGLDSASRSTLTLAGGSHEDIHAPGGAFAGLKGGGGMGARLTGRWLDDAAHKEFVKRIRGALSKVRRD